VAIEVQEYRARKAAATGAFGGVPPASASNTVATGSKQVTQRHRRITAAFAMLHRIPGVMQAVRDAAMALKRDRMGAGLESQDDDRGKQLERKVDANEQEQAITEPAITEPAMPPCEAPTTNPLNQLGPEAPMTNPSNQPGPEEQVDKAIQRTLAQDDTVLQPPKIPAATRPRMYAPTKLMQKETKYDLEAILRIMFAGRLCTGGRGVGDGGVSAERVGVGGGGRCKERGGEGGEG
jgi:hypothetical protein